MGALEHWEPRSLFPDLFDWLESPFPALRSGMGQTMRVEDYIEGDEHVIRCELPGIDPDRDVEITAGNGVLRIHAERHEEKK
ncbi:MAG: Hsp20/alpha crystallin family protein, partial [Actinomadura rubrobrunea]|nr:Hsp20/alpha crystallin family protein [Actinomadura rubrobrunea]